MNINRSGCNGMVFAYFPTGHDIVDYQRDRSAFLDIVLLSVVSVGPILTVHCCSREQCTAHSRPQERPDPRVTHASWVRTRIPEDSPPHFNLCLEHLRLRDRPA